MSDRHLTQKERQGLDNELAREERAPWRWDLLGCLMILLLALIVGGVLHTRGGVRPDPIDATTQPQPDLTPRQ
ncbi:hypothetical protein [Caulobacter sp. Root655]|uniref:hypothetical protein n=1 Tax=Caulobacter sp. Root655 TaxID=1736578 RepID=UPI0012E3B90B|nr:hypothetical protein [Caulobacter sp. Root655]